MKDWLCLPKALAALTDLSLDEILESVGHDGSAPIFCMYGHTIHIPECRRGFHIQEFIPLLYNKGLILMECQKNPLLLGISGDSLEIENPIFSTILATDNLLILGEHNHRLHAWYKRNNNVYDPDTGNIITFDNTYKLDIIFKLYKIGYEELDRILAEANRKS